MKKKIKKYSFLGIVLIAGAMMTSAAMAEGMATGDRAARKAAFKESLTAEQQTCLKNATANCPMFNKDEARDSANNVAARDCKRRGMESCGIEKTSKGKKMSADCPYGSKDKKTGEDCPYSN
ncbi:MAG: hypothetical protein FWC61_02000 [Proteobacteria bacterium]|nr:hypothetical protein [Pseudomonadota bacterium]